MNSICDGCALRLYNTKSYNLPGVGNPYMGKCIVVPNVDYSAYKGKSMSFSSQVKVIEDILFPSTGVEGSNLYIVPLIRCNEQISCEVDGFTYAKCLHWLADDIRKYQFKDILMLGNAARRFFNCNIHDYLDTLMVSANNIRYAINYSPLIRYADNKLYDVFKEKLIHWYNCVNSGVFDYNFIML